MGDKEFQALVKKVVCEYANAHLDVSDVIQISEDDVYIVWQVKVLSSAPEYTRVCKNICKPLFFCAVVCIIIKSNLG